VVAEDVPSWRLAVDFGTTATTAAVSVADGPPILLQLERDSTRMPSAVFLEKDGSLAVGRRAVHQAATAPSRFQPTPKREIGRPSISLGERQFATLDVVAAVLSRVLVTAFGQRGARAPELITLTHPVRWGKERTGVLADALVAASASLPGQLIDAGLPGPVAAAAVSLPAPVLVAEPVAAAWHYASSYNLPAGAALAVYDLGGGTFDTAVVIRRADGGFDVRAHGGLADLGGEDFDAELLAFCGARLAARHPDRWQAIVDGTGTGGADRRRLLENVQAAKEELSTWMRTECRLLDSPQAEEMLLERGDLEQLIEPHLTRSLDELAGTIARAGLTPDTLGGLYLVGGSSRIPKLADLIRDRLKIEPASLDDPKAVVATGALTAAAHPPSPPPAPVGTHGQQQAPIFPLTSATTPAAGEGAAPARTHPTPGPAPLKAELLHDIKLPWLTSAGLYRFSDDLSRVLVIPDEPRRTVGLLDARTGRRFTWTPSTLDRLHVRAVEPLILNADIAGAGARFCISVRNKALVFDASTGRKITEVTHPDMSAPRLSFDGSRFLTSGEEARVWDAATGRLVLTVSDSRGWPGRAWSASGRLAAFQGDEVTVWDAATGQKLATVINPELPQDGYWHQALSSDGTRLVIWGYAKEHGIDEVRVWDVATGRQVATINALSGLDVANAWVRLSADGALLVVSQGLFMGYGRGELRIWDVATGRQLVTARQPAEEKTWFTDVAPDGSRLAIVTSKDVSIWDCRRSAISLAGRSRNSAPGPGVDGAVAGLLSSTSVAGVMGGAGAGWPDAPRLGRGRLGPARVSCLRGRSGLRGQGRPAGPSPEAMRSSLEAGGAAPYPCAARPPARSAAALPGVSGGAAATLWSWRPRGGRSGPGLAGAAPGAVALAFQQQVVAGVEDPVQDGLADDRVGEQRVPV
jgi:hypothetical protein